MVAAPAIYFATAVAITFPLIARLTTHFPGKPGDNDVFGFIWNNWWTSHALTRLHRSPFQTDYLFTPFTIDLRLHTFGALYGLLSIPITSSGGPVLALNLQIFGTIVLNGFSAFLLARDLARDDRAALLSGLLVAATPAINFHIAMGRVSCAAVWPVILSMFLFLRLLDRPGLSRAVPLILALWAMLAADQQIALFGVLWLGVLAVARARRIADRRLLGAAVLVVALVAPAVAWLYLQPFAGAGGYTVPAASEAATYSYPIWLLWTPAPFWRVYGTVLPLGVIAAAGIAFRKRPVVPWIAGTGLCVLLSLGPSAADSSLAMPFSVLQRFPGMAQFRTPYRFQIPAAIGAAICVAYSLAFFRQRVKWGNALAILAAVVAAIDLAAYRVIEGFPLQTRSHHPIYATLADRHDARPILEVPVGVRSGTDLIGTGETLNFEQPVHQRRLINGMIARVPLEALDYYRRSPALMFLGDEADAPANELSSDLRRVLDELDVSYVVVHPPLLSEQRRATIRSLIEDFGELQRIYADPEILVFRRR